MAPRTRTAFRGATAALTGAATFAAALGSGLLAGLWAHDYDKARADQERARVRATEARSRWFAAHPVTQVVEKRRAHRTVVRTVHVQAAPTYVAPGPGSTIVSSATGHTQSSHHSSGSPSHGTAGHSSAGHGSAGPASGGSSHSGGSSPAAPHPPPPPPAPSSGS